MSNLTQLHLEARIRRTGFTSPSDYMLGQHPLEGASSNDAAMAVIDAWCINVSADTAHYLYNELLNRDIPIPHQLVEWEEAGTTHLHLFWNIASSEGPSRVSSRNRWLAEQCQGLLDSSPVPPTRPKGDFLSIPPAVSTIYEPEDFGLSVSQSGPLLEATINHRFAVVQDGKRLAYVMENHRRSSGDPAYQQIDKDSFILNLGAFDFQEGDGRKSKSLDANETYKRWLNSSKKRYYAGGFRLLGPDAKETDTYYNSWQGFGVRARDNDWSPIKDYLQYVAAKDNDSLYEYLIKWLAYLVQYPTKPAKVALIYKGNPGTGKSYLGALIHKIMGLHSLKCTRDKDLVGEFNNGAREACFVFADEMSPKSVGNATLIKNMVTSDTFSFEAKGKDKQHVENHASLLFCTNDSHTLDADLFERRWVVLESSDKRMNDRDYFGPLFDDLSGNGKMASGFLHYLKGVYLGDWRPDTDHLKINRDVMVQEQLFSLSAAQTILLESLKEGSIVCDHSQRDDNTFIRSTDLRDASSEWSSDGLPQSIRQIKADMLKLGCKYRRMSNLGGVRAYLIPRPQELKQNFIRLLGSDLPFECEFSEWASCSGLG